MFDFLMISTRRDKHGVTEIYPKFIVRNPSEDLMIRGGDYYAVWVEDKNLWCTSEQDLINLVDRELDKFANEHRNDFEGGYRILHMWDGDTGMIDKWHKYCQKQMRDSFHELDEKLIFSNTPVKKEDYASKKLPYPLENGNTDAWDQMIGTLYAPEERHKIEWAIGSIVNGDSRKLQKFLVFHGDRGTGKSTVIDVIEQLFQGYTSAFDAKALGQAGNRFALEAFKSNPLVAIQHDGDLSHIEDNSRLNSLVSHEKMTVEQKFKGLYDAAFKCFLIMGTNRPVKITDAKSGLLRRLIDVTPTGNKIPKAEYNRLKRQIGYELGAIANKCLKIYEDDPGHYDDYIPLNMLGATNDFYNFVIDSWPVFKGDDMTTLKAAWAMYKNYCEDAKVNYPFSQRAFKEELKNYFREYTERDISEDGTRIRNVYKGFRTEKFEVPKEEEKKPEKKVSGWIELKEQASKLDILLQDCQAQYATDEDKPSMRWANVQTTLKDLDTKQTHYVRPPEEHIVIDFDIPDENGEKSLERNLAEANKWPSTYAEVSKSGKGLHLHYIYRGDVKELSRMAGDHIEVKIFTGNSSLRRRLSLCNLLTVSILTSGLPKKEVKKTVNFDTVQSEKGLRTLIQRNLNKEIHSGTKPSIDFIYKILDDAYHSDLSYDVSDMQNAVVNFAARSTHQAEYCLKLVSRMKFVSEDQIRSALQNDAGHPRVFYDVEVFPNLFLVNWKLEGEGQPVMRMINPKPAEIEELMRYRLIGFNCRRYDNHILYARMMGYSNRQLYDLSQRIILGRKGDKGAFFGEAYNVSYTDVYDFASAGNKKSLKKLEIEMGIHHQELGLPWDKDVPEELWPKVAEYCDNDVIATEAAFNYLSADWTARQILADLAGMTVNDTTNSLTTRIIFDQVRKPQNEFQYRNLAEPVKELTDEVLKFLKDAKPEMMNKLHGEDEDSLLPYFPGYYYGPKLDPNQDPDLSEGEKMVIKALKSQGYVSMYHGEEVGEGGYVYAEPGMYRDVALLDVASMHPSSIIAECLFGPKFTKRFKEIVDGRVSIKHKAWDEVNHILDGKLAPYIKKVQDGQMTSKQLANALKTAINSVYGLTSAAFENAFRDPRNRDNIVAKRGALFMVDLKREVQSRGFTVAHIKTDSIKIPNATPEIIDVVMKMGARYGYSFEHEATYDRMCLVNDAVYIARYDIPERCMAKYGYVPGDVKDHPGQWTATGKQFQVPYVFKYLFSKEPIEFADECETFSVSGALYLDMNENLPNVTEWEKELDRVRKDAGLSPDDLVDFLATGTVNGEELGTVGFRIQELNNKIAEGHSYRFVGRVGEFTPVKDGTGGGLLLREAGGRYSAATNSKGYRWMESEMVRELNRFEDVDTRFYEEQVNEAIDTINKYGDFEWFVSDEDFPSPPEGDDHDGV